MNDNDRRVLVIDDSTRVECLEIDYCCVYETRKGEAYTRAEGANTQCINFTDSRHLYLSRHASPGNELIR